MVIPLFLQYFKNQINYLYQSIEDRNLQVLKCYKFNRIVLNSFLVQSNKCKSFLTHLKLFSLNIIMKQLFLGTESPGSVSCGVSVTTRKEVRWWWVNNSNGFLIVFLLAKYTSMPWGQASTEGQKASLLPFYPYSFPKRRNTRGTTSKGVYILSQMSRILLTPVQSNITE